MKIAKVRIYCLVLLSSMLCNAWYFGHNHVARKVLNRIKHKNMSTVKVTTYNVLSSSLSEPTYFTACTAENLDPHARLEKIRKKLQSEIDSKSIICLQEVSQEWAGNLYGYFLQQNYHFITALYGSKFDGYMGVAVAIPMDKYEVSNVDITRVADTKTILEKVPEKKPEGFIAESIDKLKRIWRSVVVIWTGNRPKPTEDLWDMVRKRQNQMICTELQCKDTKKSFVVGTYHMPCAFRNPDMMVVHSALSAQHVQNIAKGKPHIYLGDFNFKPDSSCYSLMINGSISKNVSSYIIVLCTLI